MAALKSAPALIKTDKASMWPCCAAINTGVALFCIRVTKVMH